MFRKVKTVWNLNSCRLAGCFWRRGTKTNCTDTWKGHNSLNLLAPSSLGHISLVLHYWLCSFSSVKANSKRQTRQGHLSLTTQSFQAWIPPARMFSYMFSTHCYLQQWSSIAASVYLSACPIVSKITRKVMNGFDGRFEEMLIRGQETDDYILAEYNVWSVLEDSFSLRDWAARQRSALSLWFLTVSCFHPVFAL